MNDIFLSKATIVAYLEDLLSRLYEEENSPKPEVWGSIGTSGGEICSEMLNLASPALKQKIELVNIDLDRSKNGGISFSDPVIKAQNLSEEVIKSSFFNKRVLLIDGLVHSGGTIKASYDAVKKYKPSILISYSTIVRDSSTFIPNYFSVLIGKYDHAWLPFDNDKKLPNKRFAGFGCIRKINSEEDLNQKIPTATRATRFQTWQDLDLNCRRFKYECLVYEKDNIIQAYVVFKEEEEKKELRIISLVVDTNYMGNVIPGNLLRWIETYSNAKHLHRILIWVTRAEFEFYQDLGYHFAEETIPENISAAMMAKDVPYPLPYGDYE
jgi:pyrimidine operon attenuation protein/uracil phosphoribosyltransferase